MAKKTTVEKVSVAVSDKPINLSEMLSSKAIYQPFRIWLVGDTPLITHAWSHKAKLEMLQKQVKATKTGKEARDPEGDFTNSLYEMGMDGKKKTFGFPITGVKNAILASAHKDKGIPRATVQSALWLNAEMVRSRPALAGAVCDVPLARIYGSDPEMREDMVRIGSGPTKTANLAYRAQFTNWAIQISGRFNPTALTAEALAFLVAEAGISSGLGEWRNERKGIFGAFHMANVAEQNRWEKFATGKGPLPIRDDQMQQAAE